MKAKVFLIAFFAFFSAHDLFAVSDMVSPEVLRKKSEIARHMLTNEKIYEYFKTVRNRKVMVAREILLAVYSPEKDSINLVRLKAPISQPKDSHHFVFSVLTPGYRVEWLGGKGVTRLVFKVTDIRGEKRVLLDAKFISLEGNAKATDGVGVFYFPFTEDFLDPEFLREGSDFLTSKILEAKKELCDLRVFSRAFPEKMICKIFPDELISSVPFMEQIDDGEFNGACPEQDCNHYSVNKILVHFARNKEAAFSYSVSRSGARGLTQFMNSKKIPTYTFIKQKYSEARLINDFAKGTRDIRNSIKAEMCLLDYNLAILPEGVRDAYLKNPKIGGIFLVAAYNGGPLRAIKLYKALVGHEIDLDHFKIPKKTLKNETKGYLQKYIAIWNMLTERR